MDVAVKRLKFPQEVLSERDETSTLTMSKEFEREVQTLIKARHPNLVLFVGACVEESNVMVLTEFCFGGTLFELLHIK